MAPSPFSLTTLRREKSQSSSDADRISIDSRQSAAVATPGGGAEPAAANEPAESPSTTAVDQTAHPAAASATAPAQPTDESALFASVVARAGSMPLEPKAGYLFKRSSGARKQWNRRWFEINLINMRLDYFSPKVLQLGRFFPFLFLHFSRTTINQPLRFTSRTRPCVPPM